MSSPKPVRCVETGEVFKSLGAAAVSIGQLYQGHSPCHISHVVNGHRPKAGGFHWEFAEQPRKIRTLHLEEALPKSYKEI